MKTEITKVPAQESCPTPICVCHHVWAVTQPGQSELCSPKSPLRGAGEQPAGIQRQMLLKEVSPSSPSLTRIAQSIHEGSIHLERIPVLHIPRAHTASNLCVSPWLL